MLKSTKLTRLGIKKLAKAFGLDVGFYNCLGQVEVYGQYNLVKKSDLEMVHEHIEDLHNTISLLEKYLGVKRVIETQTEKYIKINKK